jgi:hypothetical protein
MNTRYKGNRDKGKVKQRLEQYLFLGKGNQKALVAGVYRLT